MIIEIFCNVYWKKRSSNIWYFFLSQRTSSNKATDSSKDGIKSLNEKEPVQSSLVFGYLNLFSDGVVSKIDSFQVEWNENFHMIMQHVLILQHNFTDGMALGSAFLLYGSVGGWSRTLFLLAHELPQEVQIHPFSIHINNIVSICGTLNILLHQQIYS